MVTKNRRQFQAVFRAVADPTRRDILRVLRGGGRTVGGIAENFRVSRPAISKHLRMLRAAGLVSMRKRGTATMCELDARPLMTIQTWLRDYEEFWDESLSALKKYVEENP